MINIPVKVGDTVLMGKFKNKKVVVKDIGEDEYGMPTINGKKACTFRLVDEEELKEGELSLSRELLIIENFSKVLDKLENRYR